MTFHFWYAPISLEKHAFFVTYEESALLEDRGGESRAKARRDAFYFYQHFLYSFFFFLVFFFLSLSKAKEKKPLEVAFFVSFGA